MSASFNPCIQSYFNLQTNIPQDRTMRINRYNDYEYPPVVLQVHPIKILSHHSVSQLDAERTSQMGRSNRSSCSSKCKQRRGKGLQLSKNLIENKQNVQSSGTVNTGMLIGRNCPIQQRTFNPSKKTSLKIYRTSPFESYPIVSPQACTRQTNPQNKCSPFTNTMCTDSPRSQRKCLTINNDRGRARYQLNEGVKPCKQYYGGSIIDILLIPSQKNL